ncbi:MAG: autotransporter strand-loop-strand O-heptosyltransferase [Schwartzia sp.]|nr:autotransporter strand-loop-strand O-heptosyltransferase [Schwartzia sp. (in: firmicutes)]
MSEPENKAIIQENPAALTAEGNKVYQWGTSTVISGGGPIAGETAVPGLFIDFNLGARIQVPEGNWRVRLIDTLTGMALHDVRLSEGGSVRSDRRYYIPWRVEAYRDDELVFQYGLNLQGQEVYIQSTSKAIGDTIAWLPYAQAFKEHYQCTVHLAINPEIADMARRDYPDIHFCTPDTRPRTLASYFLGCFFPADDRAGQPENWRHLGLQKNIAAILGLPKTEIRTHLTPETESPIKEPYVCIAAQASGQAKYWNNPTGWMDLVQFLRDIGYRVLCIDRDRVYGGGSFHRNYIPYGAEDFTGALPLRDRLTLLAGADFFVGVSSGLSWLAWAAGIPVVMISGVTPPHNEFDTPYRVINYNVCNSCWCDDRYEFNADLFEWCPRHADNPARMFECSRAINSYQVIQTVRRLMDDHHLDPKRAATQE